MASTHPRHQQSPFRPAFGLALGILASCVVELAEAEDTEALAEAEDAEALDAVDAESRDGEDQGPGSCGCRPSGPQDGDLTEFRPGIPETGVPGIRVVTANCHEVVTPWCSAQMGCTYQDTVCDRRIHMEGFEATGHDVWRCEDVGAPRLRPCVTPG